MNIISKYDLVAAGTSQDYQRLQELGIAPDQLAPHRQPEI